MSETRYDWLGDRWVIFAPSRTRRPDEFAGSSAIDIHNRVDCPFCQGSEGATPAAVLSLPRGRPENWQVRVVPNKFPALQRLQNVSGLPTQMDSVSADDEDDHFSPPTTEDCVLFCRRQIRGAHEVIIETPEHKPSLTDLSLTNNRLVFRAYRQRLNYWRAHNALHYAVIFKNMGYDAGASLFHTHSQLIAANFVPPDVLRSCQRMQQYRETYERGYFSDMVESELNNRGRIITETERFVVLAPFASYVPYSCLILPKSPAARFEESDDQELNEFADLTQRVLKALQQILPDAAYNFVLHTSPFHDYWDRVFHWRLELFPRLTRVAGFEWGSDCFINSVMPETAAAAMRQALSEQAIVPEPAQV